MELLAIIGAVVLFLLLVLLIGYYFGGVSFSFHNEITGDTIQENSGNKYSICVFPLIPLTILDE